jgi:hypothetical protein
LPQARQWWRRISRPKGTAQRGLQQATVSSSCIHFTAVLTRSATPPGPFKDPNTMDIANKDFYKIEEASKWICCLSLPKPHYPRQIYTHTHIQGALPLNKRR